MTSWWLIELELELELGFACRECQGWAAEAMEARVAELLMVERATVAERGLEAVKVHQAETEGALPKSMVETEAAL